MKIQLNGEWREIRSAELTEVLAECGFGGAVVATAVNGEFVPKPVRPHVTLAEGDRLEVLAPMQGG